MMTKPAQFMDLLHSLRRAVWICAASACGCGGTADSQLEWLVDGVPSQRLVEVSMGRFEISVPVNDPERTAPGEELSIRLGFELHAMLHPGDQEMFEELIAARRGQLHDELIQICRKMDLRDLGDPGLRVVKTNLKDATDRIVGLKLVEKYLVNDVSCEPQ